MRLWSLHPAYLDAKGLVALWREGLLALKVLRGMTKGYRNHPQLERFLSVKDPERSMLYYLYWVYIEAVNRGYKFDITKIEKNIKCSQLKVTSGQLEFELAHLKNKLKYRDRERYLKIKNKRMPRPHPLFIIRSGEIETWEKML
ncbi:MAG: hypothetical protein JXN64_03530 [Spirochaetes bacterium]|nr:hypothetical protein [Spirochaetota bacterium]